MKKCEKRIFYFSRNFQFHRRDPNWNQYIDILITSCFREKYLEQELKIKQLEIELKSMKELNSHLKVFLKKKMSKTEESAKTADDLIDNATDLIINT